MTDLLSLLALLASCAVIVGVLSGDWIAWVKTEWRLIRSYRWTMDEVEQPFTTSHPDVQRTILRLADAKRRMRRERIPYLLTDGKPEWRTGTVKPRATIHQLRRAK